MNQIIAEFNKLYVKYKQPPLPFVIIVGSLKNVKLSYIVLARTKYTITGPESVIKAVNICYKSVKVLRKRFPAAARGVWQFIEYYFYQTNVGSAYKSVTNLGSKIDDLKSIANKKKAQSNAKKVRSSNDPKY